MAELNLMRESSAEMKAMEATEALAPFTFPGATFVPLSIGPQLPNWTPRPVPEFIDVKGSFTPVYHT
jgi:hypothetical protein